MGFLSPHGQLLCIHMEPIGTMKEILKEAYMVRTVIGLIAEQPRADTLNVQCHPT